MTFPYSDVISADGTIDRAILLSERTQLIAIKALQVAENRANWDDMSDSDWDTLEDYVADALTEILTESPPMTYAPQAMEIWRSTTQSIPANTPTAIIWNEGGFDASFPSQLVSTVDGAVAVSASAQIVSGVNTVVKLFIRKHTGEYMSVSDDRNSALEHNLSISYVGEASVADFFEIVVLSTASCTVQITQNLPRAGMIGFPLP